MPRGEQLKYLMPLLIEKNRKKIANQARKYTKAYEQYSDPLTTCLGFQESKRVLLSGQEACLQYINRFDRASPGPRRMDSDAVTVHAIYF